MDNYYTLPTSNYFGTKFRCKIGIIIKGVMKKIKTYNGTVDNHNKLLMKP